MLSKSLLPHKVDILNHPTDMRDHGRPVHALEIVIDNAVLGSKQILHAIVADGNDLLSIEGFPARNDIGSFEKVRVVPAFTAASWGTVPARELAYAIGSVLFQGSTSLHHRQPEALVY